MPLPLPKTVFHPGKPKLTIVYATMTTLLVWEFMVKVKTPVSSIRNTLQPTQPSPVLVPHAIRTSPARKPVLVSQTSGLPDQVVFTFVSLGQISPMLVTLGFVEIA